MVRAAYRLVLVVGITVFCLARLFAVTLAGGWSGSRVSRHAGRWARILVHTLNIDIRCSGKFPETGAMIVANHRSYLDIVVILAHVDAAFLAKAELRRWPVFGYAAQKGNTVFVDRSDRISRKASRAAILERLNQGVSVVVFPEGTTSAGPGLLPFKNGIFHMVSEQAIPVVPAAVLYPDRSVAWIGDDTFVPHFLRIFSRPGIRADLSVGLSLSGLNGGNLNTACHGFIANCLAEKEGTPATVN